MRREWLPIRRRRPAAPVYEDLPLSGRAGCPGPRRPGRGDRLRHFVPGAEISALAARLSLSATPTTPKNQLARIQPHRRRLTPVMGPCEIALGTQYDDGPEWQHEMFPRKELWPGRGERRHEVSADGRHLVPLGADRASRHRHPRRRPPVLGAASMRRAPATSSARLQITQESMTRCRRACAIIWSAASSRRWRRSRRSTISKGWDGRGVLPRPGEIRTKRVYDAPAKSDGFRVLVDRVWPRGVSRRKPPSISG